MNVYYTQASSYAQQNLLRAVRFRTFFIMNYSNTCEFAIVFM